MKRLLLLLALACGFANAQYYGPVYTPPTTEDSITAHAGGGQGSAFALSATAQYHRVATVGSSGDSVVLPTAVAGAIHCIRNDSSSGNDIQIFGTTPDTINGVATATGVNMSKNVGACFISHSANTWASLVPFTQATGTGMVGVRQTSPTLTTPNIGVATATSLNGHTFTAGSSTFTGTAAAVYTFPSVTATLAKLAGNTFTAGQNYALAAGSTDAGNTNYAIYLNAGTRSTTATLMRVSGAVSSDAYFGGPINADAIAWGIVNGAENGRITTSTGNMSLGSATDDGVNKLQVTGMSKFTGHVVSAGTVPTVATNDCGSSTQGTITAGGNDNAFLLTAGTAAVTSCAVTFATTWTAAPKACNFSPANTTAAASGTVAAYISSITTTKVTISGTALASAAFYVRCW